jgi:cyclomaltodextrinase
MSDMYTPEWVQDAVFYQIFPDRFAKSARVPKPTYLEPWEMPPTVHGYKGGDLLGVVEKLDYLQDLGVTALYFNPIFQSGSNHRYHTHDYYRVDPMLGGNRALRELLDACHARGMRVVLDGVFNHASRGFFQFHDILENGPHSAYLDWFHVYTFPLNAYGNDGAPGYAAWWQLPALPKFNTNTQAVREFLWGVATHWLEFGIDGWRLDVPNEIADDAFWQEFRRRCRAVNPECYIVGEIWDDAERWLQGDQFDAVMNYPFTRAAFGLTAATTLNQREISRCGLQYIAPLDPPAFAREVEVLLTRYRPEVTAAQLNLLGSHDTPRALTIAGGDESALRLALLLLFSFPGAPCLYYGDELGLAGGHDPGCRQGMPWNAPEGWNTALQDFVRRLAQLRLAHPALRRGSFRTLYADAELYVFARELKDERLVGALNLAPHAVSSRALPLELRAARAEPLLGAGRLEATGTAAAHLHLGARSGVLFRLM